jgi:hypothetical protein
MGRLLWIGRHVIDYHWYQNRTFTVTKYWPVVREIRFGSADIRRSKIESDGLRARMSWPLILNIHQLSDVVT